MKKHLSLFVMICAIFLITGCGEEKLVCTNEQKYGTATLDTEITVKFNKDNYATETVTKMVAAFDSKETAKAFASNYDGKEGFDVKVDKKEVTIKQTTEFAKGEVKTENNKLESVKTYLTESGFKCK